MKRLMLCLSLVAPAWLWAHELPMQTLQIQNNYQVVASFSLTQQEIEGTYNDASQYFDVEKWMLHKKVVLGVETASSGTNSYYCAKDEIPRVKTCGHIDPFFRASSAAISYCQAYAQLHGPQTLIPRFTGPASFINAYAQAADNHHDGYDTAHGLSLQCVKIVRNAVPR